MDVRVGVGVRARARVRANFRPTSVEFLNPTRLKEGYGGGSLMPLEGRFIRFQMRQAGEDFIAVEVRCGGGNWQNVGIGINFRHRGKSELGSFSFCPRYPDRCGLTHLTKTLPDELHGLFFVRSSWNTVWKTSLCCPAFSSRVPAISTNPPPPSA